MREIRTSGSEGGGTEPNRSSLPLSGCFARCPNICAQAARHWRRIRPADSRPARIIGYSSRAFVEVMEWRPAT